MVETFKTRKNTVITKITLTISNEGHIKHTLSTSKPYRLTVLFVRFACNKNNTRLASCLLDGRHRYCIETQTDVECRQPLSCRDGHTTRVSLHILV